MVTLALLFALKGRGNRAFYRWLRNNWRHLFPRLPHRTRLFRLLNSHRKWIDRFMAAGAASCLAVAVQRNGRVLTDDRDARKLAAQLKIPVSGTLGILLRLVQINVLALSEANEILGRMLAGGYRSPVEKLEDL